MKKKCERTDCFAWVRAKEQENNCDCLNEVYEDDSKCPFYKHKSEVNRRKMNKNIRTYSGPKR